MLSGAEHEKSFITSGPGLFYDNNVPIFPHYFLHLILTTDKFQLLSTCQVMPFSRTLCVAVSINAETLSLQTFLI